MYLWEGTEETERRHKEEKDLIFGRGQRLRELKHRGSETLSNTESCILGRERGDGRKAYERKGKRDY